MRIARVKTVIGAKADPTHEAHITKPKILSRHPIRARYSPSRYSIVTRSLRVHADSSVNHLESDGGGRGGVKDYFDGWWNSDGSLLASKQRRASRSNIPIADLLVNLQMVAGVESVCRSFAYF